MGNCNTPKSTKVIPDSIVSVSNFLDPLQSPKVVRNLSVGSFSMDRKESSGRLMSFKSNSERILQKSTSIKFEESKDVPTAKITEKSKTDQEKTYIKKCLSRHFLFNSLPPESLNLIIDKMKCYTLEPNSIVFAQGNPGNRFFIICSGRLEVVTDNLSSGNLVKGQSFGELSLMHNTPRPCTVTTSTFCKLWGLTREDFRHSTLSVNSKHYQEIKMFISSITMFDFLTPNQKEMLMDLLVPGEFKDGDKIVSEGEKGDLLFIIQKGIVRCSIKGKPVRDLGKGEFFGEQALLYGCTRTATVTAIQNVQTLSLHREHVVKVLGTQLQQVIYKNTQRFAIENSKGLKDLPVKHREQIINSMKISTYLAGAIVIQKGLPRGNKLYIIVKGSATYLGKLHKFSSCFGDNDLLKRAAGKYDDNLVCVDTTEIAEISREEIEGIVGGELRVVIEKNIILSILKQVQLFRSLPRQKFESLVKLLHIKEFQKNQFIFHQGEPGLNFFIIKEGEVDIIKDGNILRTLGQFDFFGERSILYKESRTASAKAKEKVATWVLTKDDFFHVIDSGMRSQLLKRIQLQDDTLTLDDMCPIKILGKGTFGTVLLTVSRKTNTPYAIKSVPRKSISMYKIQENLTLERKILLKVDHVFIVKLVKTLKDPQRIYFILEYIKGIGLFDTLRTLNILKNDDCRFYIGILILILEHLHERNIIYRDLKPENIMVDEEGYLKLIDFGTAKLIEGKTFTVLGTPHYMAPEVILGKGYSFPADIWSLGILSYEFASGKLPFGDEEKDPYKIYELILDCRYTYPPFMRNNPRIKIFIDQLLVVSPNCRGSAESLKDHKWLSGFDWDGLLSKKLHPPHFPLLESLVSEVSQSKIVNNEIQQVFDAEEGIASPLPSTAWSLEEEEWDKEF